MLKPHDLLGSKRFFRLERIAFDFTAVKHFKFFGVTLPDFNDLEYIGRVGFEAR